MVNNWLEDALSFSRSERRGLSVLLVLCVLSGLYSFLIPRLISGKEIREFERELPISFFSVPAPENNSLDTTSERMSQVASINSQSKSDVVQPNPKHHYKSPAIKTDHASQSIPEQLSEIRINTMDAKAIIQSNALPSEIAFRLVKFREQLGGFHSVSQLQDIYGITDTIYNRAIDHVVIEKMDVRQIFVNSASAEELQKHPYISPGLARQIVNFRDKVKPFATQEDLLRLYFMDEALVRKLMPYISFY